MNSHLPSHHLPDFLKMDLAVGSPDAHPLMGVLDSWLEAQSLASGLATALAQSGLGSVHTEAREFRGHQLEVHTLTADEKTALYQLLPSLWAQRLHLAALEQLAKIYFGNAQVRRGFPYAQNRLENTARLPLRLSETGDSDRVIFVETGTEFEEHRGEEFLKNARRLVPDHFTVTLCGTRQPAQALRNVIALMPQTRMKGWRL